MMIKIVLLNEPQIQGTLEEEENELHCDGVRYVESVINELRGMAVLYIKDFFTYGNKYAIGIEKENGVVTYISPRWVDIMTDGVKTDMALSSEGKKHGNYLEYREGYVIDVEQMSIHKKTDLNLCGCGAVIGNDTVLREACLCADCYTQEHFYVNNYSFKPTPEFTGPQIASNAGNEVWYGLELEYGLHSKLGITKLVKQHKLYLKSDSSIATASAGGAEMVSHPHSFTALMAEDSFVNKVDTIDCNESDRNGCHIHVGRTAWVDDKHFALTYFLMYELATMGVLEKIGGRNFTNYCNLEQPTERIHQMKKEKQEGLSKTRTLWCNENNDATVEFRFFKSTNNVKQLKRYIQLLESVIKYTKFHKKTVSTSGLIAYIRKYSRKYAELSEFLGTITIDDRTVTYTEPQSKTLDIRALTILEIPYISSITMRSGNVYSNIRGAQVDRGMIHFSSDGRHESVAIELIDTLTIEV